VTVAADPAAIRAQRDRLLYVNGQPWIAWGVTYGHSPVYAGPADPGHGGYWNRFEFEKAPFFDIYDPETEPLYPANLHTDLMPLIAGKPKVAWLRPQMHENVPYERWRYHIPP
jgi:hypothetical protein